MSWDAFLKQAAETHGLKGEDKQAFLERFAERNLQKLDRKVADDFGTSESNFQKRLGKVYKLFARSCPDLDIATKGKFNILLDWLKTEYVCYEETGELPWLPTTSELVTSKSAIASGTVQSPNTNTAHQRGISEDFYMEPSVINSCYNEILKPGCLLRIKAPWKMGKTELMSRVLNHAANRGYLIARLNLRDATTTDFNDLNQFLKWFCTSIAQELSLTNSVDEHWNKSIGNIKNKCKTYFEKYLLPRESPLVVALDDIDRVFPYPKIASEFFGMLRTRHEDAKTRPIWRKFRQVLAYIEDYREMEINQSPFNVGRRIELPELSFEQVQYFAQQYELNWDTNQVNQLMEMVGGHPYLVKEAIRHVTQQSATLDEMLEKAPTQAGIYSEHLQKYWRRLQQTQELATAFSKVVMAEAPVELNPEWAEKLYNLGLVKIEGSSVIVRYELYRRYFRFCFGSTR